MSRNFSEISKVEAAHAMSKLKGERGLLIGIVAQAWKDLRYGPPAVRQDAADYFTGETFRTHMSWLELQELDVDTLPVMELVKGIGT